MGKNKKNRTGIVYSTNPDFNYNYGEHEEEATIAPEKQRLKVSIDRKKRRGKVVTLVSGFVGTENDLKSLGKKLKTKCGVGGSAKEGEIIVQGDHKQRVLTLLKGMGYIKTRAI